jgi:hypothetical protein
MAATQQTSVSNQPADPTPSPKPGAQEAPINSVGPGNTADTTRTVSDVIEHVRAVEAGQPSPHDIPDHVVEAARRSGAIPLAQGARGQVVRPDQQVPGGMQTFGPNTMTPDEALQQYGPDSTEMVFPRPVSFNTDDRKTIHYPAGTHQVPSKLASNPFFKANGASPKADPEVRNLPPTPEGREKTAAPARR